MEYVTLLGADDVRAAANAIREAAHDMKQAAETIRFAFENNQRFMEQWIEDWRAMHKEHDDLVEKVRNGLDAAKTALAASEEGK